MKWQYKVVLTKSLLQNNSDNHDIAVSVEEVNSIETKARANLETELNELGKDAWEFVTLIGNFGIFKKQIN